MQKCVRAINTTLHNIGAAIGLHGSASVSSYASLSVLRFTFFFLPSLSFADLYQM